MRGRTLVVLGALSLGLAESQAAPPGMLTIRFMDVGQGDAVLITSPEGKSLLYDGGRSESRMRELIRQYQVTSLELIAASHGDADHITGLIPAAALFKPKYFLNNGIAATTQTWGRLTKVVSLAGTQGLLAKDQTITLGSVKIRVLPPPPGLGDEQNVNSVGLLIQYGAFRALMTGDSEVPETRAWLQKNPAHALGPVDVYKSIHHGAANGDSAAWLAAVQPKNVVVSVGPNNYGHPTRSALDLYARVGARIFRTDRQGTVTVTVQPGGAYRITTEKGPAAPAPTPAAPLPERRQAPAVPVSYASCAAVRAAGKSPVLLGQPGYSRRLDQDGDGRACE